LKDPPGKRVDRNIHGLPDLQLAQRLLRQVEIDKKRVQLLQGDDLGADRQILADIDLTDAEPPCERRADLLLRHQRLLRLHLCLRGLQIGAIGIDLTLRHGVGAELFHVALIIDLIECYGRLQLRQHRRIVVGP
jgi:hypothetical protein